MKIKKQYRIILLVVLLILATSYAMVLIISNNKVKALTRLCPICGKNATCERTGPGYHQTSCTDTECDWIDDEDACQYNSEHRCKYCNQPASDVGKSMTHTFENGTCTVCGATQSSSGGSGSGGTTCDGVNHKWDASSGTCEWCGAICEHTPEFHNKLIPAPSGEAKHYRHCDTCGYDSTLEPCTFDSNGECECGNTRDACTHPNGHYVYFNNDKHYYY